MVSFEYNLQRLGKGGVAIEVVEAEPAFLRLFGEAGKSFVDGFPVTEVFQTGRPTFSERFFEVKPSEVVDIVIEVDVHLSRRVVQEEPSCL